MDKIYMMMKTIAFLIGFLVFSSLTSYSQTLNRIEKGVDFMKVNEVKFEKNKGQVTGKDAEKVKYTYQKGGLSVFLMEKGIAYQFSKTHYPKGYKHLNQLASPEEQDKMKKLEKDIRVETYRMDVILEGANLSSSITEEGKSNDYIHYYNHNTLDVHFYNKITYHDVYPNIDWVIYTKDGNLKYDFIVHPGGDLKNIILSTKWVEELNLNSKGDLVFKNIMGAITEEKPLSLQEGKEIETSFVLSNNQISFNVANYNPKKDLVIDPLVRDWATYYGGSDSDFGFDCTTDLSGNVYISGRTLSSTNIASGGHDNTFGGSNGDAFLVKFNAAGVRQWATYYGGTAEENASGCAVNASGDVFLAGYTKSSSGIASSGHDNTYGGGTNYGDAFLVKFNAAGVRQWATYYGGSDDESNWDCAVDNSGNVYMVGFTKSTSSIASGGHQNSYGGGGVATGSGDAFLVKFNTLGTRIWATYYGGSNEEIGYDCAIDQTNNVYITGYTTSSSGIASGGFQNTFGGSSDGFLVKFNSSGTRQWATYYGGTSGELVTGVVTDGSSNVYIGGMTNSSSGIASGGHDNTYGGGTGDSFLAKFNSSGTRQWATYYGGGAGFASNSGVAVDNSNNVYLTGLTTATSGVALSGFDNTYSGSNDAYLVKFNSAGVRQRATYYGGTGSESVSACAVDGNNIYILGSTSSTTSIASGGHQNTYGGGALDVFLVKLSDCVPETNTTTTVAICENATKSLTSSGSGLGTWSIVGGGGSISGNTYTPANVSSNTSVTIRYTDGCGNTSDRIFTVNVYNVANNTTSTTSICEGNTKALTGTPSGGSWSIVSGGGSITGTTYTAPSIASNTSVTIKYRIPASGPCPADSANVTFTVTNSVPVTNTTNTSAICETGTKSLAGTPSGGVWSIVSGGGSITGTTYNPPNVSSNTTVTVKYRVNGSGGCPADSANATFTVQPTITPTITSSAADMCSGDTRALTGTPAGGTWSVVSGPGSISGSTLTANVAGTIQVRYRIVNACGNNDALQNITVSNTIVVSVTSSNASLCEGDTISLTGTPTGGAWNLLTPASGTLTGNFFTASGQGIANIEYAVTSSCGNGADTINIVTNPLPNASAGLDENICIGDSVTLMATGGVSYQWNPGPASANNQVYPSVTTGYRVDVTSDSGCVASDSVTVFLQTPGMVDAQDDQGVVVTGTSETVDVYVNDIGSVNSMQIIGRPSSGTATLNNGNVVYTSNLGFVGNDTIEYVICDAVCEVLCDTAFVYLVVDNDLTIPIGISPNDDGKNDVFNILGISRYPDNHLYIYNRWGSLVFEAQPYLNDWNGQNTSGSLMGNEVVEGTYFYILELGEDIPARKGYIELKK